ncbi:hypothetical protein F7725_007677, partial [Dissostichus mawsoni]
MVTRKKTIILGHSNLSRTPSFSHPNLQIDSFPGAKFHHITAILNKLSPCHNTTQVIVSIGLNNGLSETSLTTSTKQLQAMWKQTTTTFPNATIYIPIINFSDLLNPQQQTLLTTINNTIALKYNFIPEINPLLFRVLEGTVTFIDGDNCQITTPHQSNITNLSAVFSLTTAQLEVLDKGLAFIPTPKPHTRPELRADLHAFHRRIKIRDHFLGSQGREPVPFTRPSTWEPYTDTLTPEITQLINKNLDTLRHWRPLPQTNFEGARADCDTLRECRLISAYRRNKNLKDLLVHTKLKDNRVRAREAPRISDVGLIRLLHIFYPFSKLGANLGRACNLQPRTRCKPSAVTVRAFSTFIFNSTAQRTSCLWAWRAAGAGPRHRDERRRG